MSIICRLWVELVALMKEMRNANKISIGKVAGERQIWRPRCGLDGNIKTDLKKLFHQVLD